MQRCKDGKRHEERRKEKRCEKEKIMSNDLLKEHECFEDFCLYCHITHLFSYIDKLKKINSRLAKELYLKKTGKEKVDKKIEKLEKDTKKLVRQEVSLKKADKKRDKLVDLGKKVSEEKKSSKKK